MIGLCGAHRTGKTTLAEAFSAAAGIDMLDSKTTQAFKDMGFEVGQELTFDERLKVQWKILEGFEERYRDAGKSFIADRTPLDMAAYVMADMRLHDLTPRQVEEAMVYVGECLDVCSTYFLAIVLVPPGIPYVEEEGKPPLDVAYQEIVHTLISGLMMEDEVSSTPHALSRNVTDPNERLDLLMKVWEETVKSTTEAMADQVMH